MSRTRGAVYLERYAAEKRGGLQKSLEGTGVSYESLRRYIRGITVPSIADADALQTWSGGRVRIADWAVPADPAPADPAPAEPGDVVRALESGPEAA